MLKSITLSTLFAIIVTAALGANANAQECFIGEVRLFAGNFAPRGWALCDGQLLPIAQNTALFSILGTTYGGDGRTTFALPDLRGRAPIHAGSGPGLSPRALGQKGGEESHVLTIEELPAHSHTVNARNQNGNTNTPDGNVLAKKKKLYSTEPPDVILDSAAIGETGQGVAQNNMPPFQALNYIICLQGIFPSRN